MPAVTRSKSPCKKASADQNQASSSAANTSANVAPVANMQAPADGALAGVNNAFSDAMVPALAPLSPSKRKRSAKTLSDDEGVGAQPSEPMKRTRVERSDTSRSHLTSGQPDLAATTYSQVERVVLGLEDTPVFGATGGAPKEGLDAAASTPTSSPKSVETTAAAPVLDGEENGAMAKAPISAVSPKTGITNTCKCDELATKLQEITGLKAAVAKAENDAEEAIAQSQAIFQKKFKEAVEETNAIEASEKETRAEYNKIRDAMRDHLQSTHRLRRENERLSDLYEGQKREKEELAARNLVLREDIAQYREVFDLMNKRVPILTADQIELERTKKLLAAEKVKNAEYEGQFQESAEFFGANKVVKSIEPVDPAQGGVFHENHNYEEHAQEDRSRRYRTPTPAGTQKSHRASSLVGFRESSRWECLHDRGYNGNTCRHCGDHVLAEGHPEFDRERSVAPADDLPPNFSDEEEEDRNRESASYEPAEAVINNQDEPEKVGSPVLTGNEDYEDNDQEDRPQDDGASDLYDYEHYENENQQDHQESLHPAAAVEKTTSAPSESHPSSSPSPSSSKKRKESPVSASSPAKKVESTETELAGPSSTDTPRVIIDFKPANSGWGSPSVLSPQVAVTAPALSTPSSASSFPTFITRSGAAVQFGAATAFGAIGTAGPSVRFGATNSFGVPALSAKSSSVAASPKEDNAEEDKPADQNK
ncbi:hypothetical protein BELL_0115g00140 [Botrytis elliptica]|uniref:Uncharacterized protein n=1 Tax=Botrytis elliptica TaxID=278938 RepID=A0A4Z1K1C8_9HELO|nr:hypothetical protein EAE99_011505 [Botrytis elliptica]TGO77272.1 hypothetical protein BELL_0115g00140 [Botrytis elliptica]